MSDRGFDFETLVERLIAPTARRLGELWHEDLCDFFDVTLGVGRLQELIDLLATPVQEREQKALLIATPGDTHFFGLDVVAAFLRASGWRVTMQTGLALEENASTVAEEWISVVGITVGGPPFLEATARTVETLRRASRNPDIAVMVGGHIFNRRPELVARIGADGTAPDGPTAVVLAKRLLLRQTMAMS
jgi:methylmalonyl-CoA mutase cobalamin-binding domain/chain